MILAAHIPSLITEDLTYLLPRAYDRAQSISIIPLKIAFLAPRTDRDERSTLDFEAEEQGSPEMGACDMSSAIRFRHMAIAVVFFCTTPCLVHGQSACAQLGVDCSHPNTSSGSSGASGGPADGGPIGLILGLPGDIRRAHEKAKESKIAKEGTALNDQGLAFYNSRDWAAAEDHFKECLKYYPNDQVVRRNLALTQGQEGEDAYRKGDFSTAVSYFRQALSNDPTDDPEKRVLNDDLSAAQGKIANIQQDKIAAANIQQTVQSLAQSLIVASSPNITSSPGGLDFSDGGSTSNSDNSRELKFTDSDPTLRDAVADKPTQGSAGGCTNSFGIQGCPSHPDLNDAAPAEKTTINSNRDALTSINTSATNAAGVGNSPESMKNQAGIGLDERPTAAPTTIPINKSTPQSPYAGLSPSVAKALASDKKYQAAVAKAAQANSDLDNANSKLKVLEAKPPSDANTNAINSVKQQQADALNAIDQATATKNQVIYSYTVLPAASTGLPGSGPPPPAPPDPK